jgi:hypothetical protein
MSAALEISDYGRVLQVIEEELENIDEQLAILLQRKSVLIVSGNKILSDVRELASVQKFGHGGGVYGIRGMGRTHLRAA